MKRYHCRLDRNSVLDRYTQERFKPGNVLTACNAEFLKELLDRVWFGQEVRCGFRSILGDAGHGQHDVPLAQGGPQRD